jgi:two-component system cell cycle sensor histidine kinase/response regulator CckA
MMPVMDGVEMVCNLRNRYPQLPVVFMSGYLGSPLMASDLINRIENLSCPLIAKPYKADQMLHAVRASLECANA